MVCRVTPSPPTAWTWPTHPDGTLMTIREMTPEDREMAHRRALENAKRAAALSDLAALDGETM